MTPQDKAKKAAGERAASQAETGMVVGLGTGSTAAFALKELGRRIAEDGLQIQGVPTSFFSERLAKSVGIPVIPVDDVRSIDLAIDGADEVSPDFHLIKGRGGAHTREKVVAKLSSRFIVLVDESKMVATLGERMPLPVEVLPMAIGPVEREMERLGGFPTLRMGERKDGPVVSDQGFWILDVDFPDGISDPHDLDRKIHGIPGVLEHGLFLDLATDVFLGRADGSVEVSERGR